MRKGVASIVSFLKKTSKGNILAKLLDKCIHLQMVGQQCFFSKFEQIRLPLAYSVIEYIKCLRCLFWKSADNRVCFLIAEKRDSAYIFFCEEGCQYISIWVECIGILELQSVVLKLLICMISVFLMNLHT